jgi:predicted anti-sigma-YlaC factor YlaD
MECQRVRVVMYRMTNDPQDEVVASFRDHLGLCPACAQYFSYVSKLLTLVRVRCCRYDAPPSLRVRILASLPHRAGSIELE